MPIKSKHQFVFFSFLSTFYLGTDTALGTNKEKMHNVNQVPFGKMSLTHWIVFYRFGRRSIIKDRHTGAGVQHKH